MRLITSFFLEGRPQPKQRARVTRRGAYTPRQTRDWEKSVGWSAKARMNTGPYIGAVRVDMTVYYRPPKSWPAARREAAVKGSEYPTASGQADLSNILKGVEDGMNGVAYVDDRQVVATRCTKRYGNIEGVAVSVSTTAVNRSRSEP